MLVVENIELSEAYDKRLNSISDFNMAAADIRLKLQQEFRMQIEAGILLDFGRALRQANRRHVKLMGDWARIATRLKNAQSRWNQWSRGVNLYLRSTTLRASEVYQMWQGLLFTGSDKFVLANMQDLSEAYPDSARDLGQFYSVATASSGYDKLPRHLTRVGEVAVWARLQKIVPLGGTPADDVFRPLFSYAVNRLRESAKNINEDANQIRERLQNMNIEFFKRQLDVPNSIMPSKTDKKV